MMSDGVIAGPAGDGRVAAVARDDVAAGRGGRARHRRPRGATSDVTGAEALILKEVAPRLGAAYEDETIEEAWSSARLHGAPRWQVEAWISSYTAIAAGGLETVSDTVRRLTGREPLTLAQL